MKATFRKMHWVLSEQFGIDLRRLFRSVRAVPGFVSDLVRYRRLDRTKLRLQPCLHDRYAQGGAAGSEYFIQDLYVARKIHQRQPRRHVDIGSRIDGFVAHVASFREIEVLDIRPLHNAIPGVIFRQADLMADTLPTLNLCDSLSCLHALEHCGLGRYGDTLDAQGSRKGLHNMARLLQPCGLLYLSVPIGMERVVFNANRVFDPLTILQWAGESGLSLQAFAQVTAEEGVQEHAEWSTAIERARGMDYALCIFTFRREEG
jgi:hypothetical protein